MTLDGRGDDRRTTVERVDPAASRVSLYWRVFAVNAAILSVAVLLLIVTPVSIDPRPTRSQLVVLVGGLLVMLVANAWLVRFSLRPLRRLSELMSVVDVLEPGRRLDPAATAEVAAVISTFNSTLDRLEGERRASMHRVLAAQEAERRRIAQELHDQIGQNLTAVVLELKRVRERIDPGEADALADAQELARESLEEVRRISYELRPAALDDLGLASALASLCSGIERRAGIAVQLAVAGDVPALDGQVELAVYRIAQEALTNAARHAQCKTVRVLARPRCRRRAPARVGQRDRHERQLPGRRDARHARARGRGRRHARDPTGGRRRDRGLDAYPRCGGAAHDGDGPAHDPDPARRRPRRGAPRPADGARDRARHGGRLRGRRRARGGRARDPRGGRPGGARRHDAADERAPGGARAVPARAVASHPDALDAPQRAVLPRGPSRRCRRVRAEVGGRPRPDPRLPGGDARRAVHVPRLGAADARERPRAGGRRRHRPAHPPRVRDPGPRSPRGTPRARSPRCS